MAVRDRSTLDVDEVFRELELMQTGQRDRGERLVDFDAMNEPIARRDGSP
jgi:hypothetical protein